MVRSQLMWFIWWNWNLTYCVLLMSYPVVMKCPLLCPHPTPCPSLHCIFFFLSNFLSNFIREWPNPVLLKQPEDSNLNLPVWDPRVSILMFIVYSFSRLYAFSDFTISSVVVLLSGESIRQVSPDANHHTCIPTTELYLQCVYFHTHHHEWRVQEWYII